MAPVLRMQQSPVCIGPLVRTSVETPGKSQCRIGSRKCKIICTIGPTCQDTATLVRLIDAGMDACCVSFFSDTKEAHAKTIQNIREAARMRPGKQVAIILDPRTPEMRTGFLASGGVLNLTAGSQLRLVTDMSVSGDEQRVAASCRRLPSLLRPGAALICAGGAAALEVLECRRGEVLTRVLRDGRLGERSELCVPGAAAPAPQSPAALRGAARFALAQGVDFVLASSARGVMDMRYIQEELGTEGRRIGVLARIDCEAGLKHFEDVLREGDGVVVARAELAARLSPERALLAQKLLVAKCSAAGKPVVIASQVLQSMVCAPSPSRAEASDVVNAALDGADSVLLGEATAIGGFPEAAVATARSCCLEAAAAAEPSPPVAVQWAGRGEGSLEAVCCAAVETASRTRAKFLVAVTETGRLARALALHRPRAPVFAVTGSAQTARLLQVSRGVHTLVAEASSDSLQIASRAAVRAGLASPGDVMVAVLAAPGAEDGEAPENGEPAFDLKQLVVRGSTGAPRLSLDKIVPRSSDVRTAQAALCLPGALSDLAAAGGAPAAGRGCKIACSLGPNWGAEQLLALIDAGVDVFCLNFAQGDHASHAASVLRVREAAALRPERTVAIQLDTKGPEVWTGPLQSGGPIDLKAGQSLKLTTDCSVPGDAECVGVGWPKLPAAARPGMQICVANGALMLEVVSCSPTHVMTKVLNDFRLGQRQSVQLPGVQMELPVLQPKDRDDIANFAVPQGVDFLAVSYVQSAKDVRFVRGSLGRKGQGIKIIAKIENEVGLQNFDEILAESDGIMVVRGNLGVHIPPERVVLAQKAMISKCNAAGKVVITATHLLRSMGESPEPAQAEVADVANTVLDGADCMMLSGEMASGALPEAAVRSLRRICELAEASAEPPAPAALGRRQQSREAAAAAFAAKAAAEEAAQLVLAAAPSAEAVASLVCARPAVPVLAVMPDARAARQLTALRRFVPVCEELAGSGEAAEEVLAKVCRQVKKMGLCKAGQKVVILRGTDVEVMQMPEDVAMAADSDIVNLKEVAGGWQLFSGLKKSGVPGTLKSTAYGAYTLAAATATTTTLTVPRLVVSSLAMLLKLEPSKLITPRSALLPVDEPSKRFFEDNQLRKEVVSLPSGLQYKVLQKGTGNDHPVADSTCVCQYEGCVVQQWPDGRPFDSTFARGEPAELRPEEGIRGWQEALERMVEGDRWEVYIPSELAYAERGSHPHVAPGQGLVFTVELLEILGERQPAGRRASFLLGDNTEKRDNTEKLDMEAVEADTEATLAALGA